MGIYNGNRRKPVKKSRVGKKEMSLLSEKKQKESVLKNLKKKHTILRLMNG